MPKTCVVTILYLFKGNMPVIKKSVRVSLHILKVCFFCCS